MFLYLVIISTHFNKEIEYEKNIAKFINIQYYYL